MIARGEQRWDKVLTITKTKWPWRQITKDKRNREKREEKRKGWEDVGPETETRHARKRCGGGKEPKGTGKAR